MSKLQSSHSSLTTLDEWLFYLENLHSTEIDLGLNRIGKVAKRLSINFDFATVITVAGTNGKGTTCAFIENALREEEHNVAVYSSPHIETFNERLRINDLNVEDAPLIKAFDKIESARAEISLTYYEYTTLAAFLVLMELKPSYIILEVGLGGRLDATNIIDADISVVTTIDIDHKDFLGDNRESIGFEKAGIFRGNGLSVIGDIDPPMSLKKYALSIQTETYYREASFKVKRDTSSWHWSYEDLVLADLKQPFIPLDNVSTALMVLHLLHISLNSLKVNKLIEKTKVAGRTELISLDKGHALLDVGHNPQAAKYLASWLSEHQYANVYAVMGMLKDKDIKEVVFNLKNNITHWYFGELSVPRAASSEEMANTLSNHTSNFNCFDNVTQAFKMASQKANEDDLILVFGSFFTVAEVRRLLINKHL